jgi:hypothetical protein
VRCSFAGDGCGDFSSKSAADCVEARADRLELGVIGGGDGHEQRRAPGFGLNLDDPQAIEGWIIELACEHQIHALVDLPAQLPDLALDRDLVGRERRAVGRPAAATTTIV